MNLKNLIKEGAIYSIGIATLWTAVNSASQYVIISQGVRESRKHPEITLNLEEYESELRKWPSEKDAINELEKRLLPFIGPILKIGVEIPSRPGRELAYWVYNK